MGNKLLMSTAFHPQTDGVSERAIQTISQILRSVVRPDQTDWVDRLPLVKFAINSSVNASTGFAPFELTYGYMPRTLRTLENTPAMPGVRAFADRAVENLLIAHDAIIESRVTQTTHANRRRRADNPTGDDQPRYEAGKLVYLSTRNLSLPKGRANKLAPRYVDPYRIVRAHPDTSNYTLELPDELRKRRIHLTFHVSLLRPHQPNDDTMFPGRDVTRFYDFGFDGEQEYLVDDILTHRWAGRRIEFLVCFDDGDILWESYDNCKDLEALDRYLELQGVSDW